MKNVVRNPFLYVGIFITIISFYFFSTSNYVVVYKNIVRAEIVDKYGNVVAPIPSSGTSVRLLKSNIYAVRYVGETGFSSGSVNFKDNRSVEVNPYFSDEKLSQLMRAESDSIDNALMGYFPGISNYSYKRKLLFHFGEWCGVHLTYKGEYGDSTDDIRIVLHKTGSKWSLSTTPSPYLTVYNSPGVPTDILDILNN